MLYKKESKIWFKTIAFLSSKKLEQLQKMSGDEKSESEFYHPDELELQEENEVVSWLS